MFGLQNRDTLSTDVADEFENLFKKLRQFLLNQHTDEGKHDVITGTSIAVTGSATFGNPRAHVFPQSVVIPNNVGTNITFNLRPGSTGIQQGWNVGGMFDETKPDRITVKEDGLYQVSFAVDTGFANNVGICNVTVVVEPGTPGFSSFLSMGETYLPNDARGVGHTLSMTLPLLAGWSVTLSMTQTSGVNAGTVATTATFFEVTKVG